MSAPRIVHSPPPPPPIVAPRHPVHDDGGPGTRVGEPHAVHSPEAHAHDLASEGPPSLNDLRLASARRLSRPVKGHAPAKWLMAFLFAGLGAMLLPWQQSVQGKGELTALSPSDRPQVVPTAIGGRLVSWHVEEGAPVVKGQLIARLAEVKVEYLDSTTIDRYREQLAAKREALEAKRAKAASLAEQIAALEQGLVLSRDKARNTVSLYSASASAAAADSAVAQDQLERRERLAREGLASTNDLQAARLRYQQSVARVVEKRAEFRNGQIELGALGASYGEKLAKARADRSATLAEVSEGEAEASKLRNAVDNLALRNRLAEVRAPQDGYIVRAMRAGIGEQLKEGDPLVTVMPARPRLAASVYISGVDVPLVSPGRRVRLQFDGWPALQFSGWPRAAIGTFGGIVAVVDRVGAPNGTFRVLVSPDPADEAWPEALRQGSGVIAWAMLDEVTLGYELWRRANGFPQSLAAPIEGGMATGKEK